MRIFMDISCKVKEPLKFQFFVMRSHSPHYFHSKFSFFRYKGQVCTVSLMGEWYDGFEFLHLVGTSYTF